MFPDSGIMAVGWNKIDGDYYYFNELHTTNPNWYYLEYNDTWKSYGKIEKSYGSMYRNEVTPDGQYVDENGKLITNLASN